jgi:hypothetical protein
LGGAGSSHVLAQQNCCKTGTAGSPAAVAKPTKVFWFFFSKKNGKNKHFFLKKEAKTFVCLASALTSAYGLIRAAS